MEKNGNLAADVFKQWFNDHKYSYNKANWLMNDTTAFYSDIDLRNLITPKHSLGFKYTKRDTS